MVDTKAPGAPGAPDANGHSQKDKSSRPKATNKNRGKRLADKHTQRLPLITKPLPLFVPGNPFSLIHILWVIVSEYVLPYSSQPKEKYVCMFSPNSRSIHVTDTMTVRALWEKGFFGKGSLSRSEPNWLEAEQKRVGLKGGQTAEEWTRKRRQERMVMKMERARIEQEAIEEQKRRELKVLEDAKQAKDATFPETQTGATNTTGWNPARIPLEFGRDLPTGNRKINGFAVEDRPNGLDPGKVAPSSRAEPSDEPVLIASEATALATHEDILLDEQLREGEGRDEEAPHTIINQEHLQLSLEEAFFLSYSFDVLDIAFPTELKPPTTNSDLLKLFRRYSVFPPLSSDAALQLDDPFMLHYVVYHHFRSLGWVVRDGIKFAVDYLLYERGPAFKHAEFAVQIIPSFSHPYWSETEERRRYVVQDRQKRSWHWFHCINRVQTQVTKTLVLCQVDIPPPDEADALTTHVDIGALLKRYRIREFCFRRWSANRNRG